MCEAIEKLLPVQPIRLEPTGMVTVMVSVTEQGQGTEAIFAQIAATAVGVSLDKVRVITGDTGTTPYGGGTWASRGAGIGGEAVLQAGKALRSNILDVAAAMLQDLGVLSVELMTNNPDKVAALGHFGIEVVERVPHALDRHADVRRARAVDEFEGVDGVADVPQGLREAHAFGHVPASAEEIHHVAFAAQARLALDYQRIETVALELDGERQPRNATTGNEDAFGVHALPRRWCLKTPRRATWHRTRSSRRRGWI